MWKSLKSLKLLNTTIPVAVADATPDANMAAADKWKL